MVKTLTKDDVWHALEGVMDPEIPVVSVVEMGIVRAVELRDDAVIVSMTPTFAGCPALVAIREAILETLHGMGLTRAEVKTVLSPPWSSDWMTEAARAKMKALGLAPPNYVNGNVQVYFLTEVACPYCGSTNTRVKNNFGPTLCRAIYYCRNCQQPFEQFKAL